MIKTILSYLFIAIAFCSNGQDSLTIHKCDQQNHSFEIRKSNPEISSTRIDNERKIQSWLTRKTTTTQSVISIPVVFHILYNTPEQNLSEAQVLAQLEALNKDFRRNNPDTVLTPDRFKPFVTDTEIEFCMALQTPDGFLTNGITRQETNIIGIGNTDKYYKPTQGGTQIWNPEVYLNIWVCEINDTLLGYTYLPGEADPSFDGIVLNYKVCGDPFYISAPYNKGRTLVHEIGHWLNLEHPWGQEESCNSDDFVTDTPLQEKPNYQCPNAIVISCGNSPDGDMYMNYMDYTFDQCQNSFTYGQKDRMLATLNTSRKALLSSVGCTYPDTAKLFVETLEVFPIPAQNFLIIKFQFKESQNADIIIFDITGKLVYHTNILVEIERVNIDISQFPNGSYLVKVVSNDMNRIFKVLKTE
jgi:hypothetical protein